MAALGRNRLFCFYVLISCALVGVISILQCFKYDIFGTDLLLGWDSPEYVWGARQVLTDGPLYLVGTTRYPNLYVQLLAFLGYFAGNVVVVERVLPFVFIIVLIFANSRITHRITGNVHVAGLAALFTSLSINTLRLYADLNRNLMALSLSFVSFLLVSDFLSQNVVSRKMILGKTYLSIVAVFSVIMGTHFETFFVLVLSSILLGISSKNWRKLVALTFAWAIPTILLLAFLPQIPASYFLRIGQFTNELHLDEIFLWSGGSWILMGFLAVGVFHMSFRAIRRKDALAFLVFSWTSITVALFILTMQGIIPFSGQYAYRALLILPVPILFASAVFAFGSLLKDTFLEIGMSSPLKKYAVKINLKHVALVATASILLIGSTAIVLQHYDEFLTPYILRSSYDKVSYACEFLDKNGLSKPIVLFYGEHSYWFADLYSSYIGSEIGDHFSYKGDISGLLQYYATWSKYSNQTQRPNPILVITPYLYDKEVPYIITSYHIGQGIYVVPPTATISYEINYGPEVSVATESSIEEIKSEYLYADQNDPSIIVLRVTVGGHISYTFKDYPADWVFLKLEQGGDLSFPENDPHRLNGAIAEEGNDPTESTQDWSMSQTGTISVDNSPTKEGYANLKVEGFTDPWGNLGVKYNPVGTWDLTSQSFLAVWAKADTETTFSITLTDVAGNTRTYWDLKPDGSSATTHWKRFAVDLSNYTSQSQSFDLSRVDSVDFYVYSNPGKLLSFWIDDPVVDSAPTLEGVVRKARVHLEDPVTLYFWTRLD